MPKYHCHVISNTHWDREWRYTFQGYRFDLVDMMDHLIELLETEPKYHSFFLDSQTTILEDYLEIRPEKESRVRKLVKANRLQIGPWYTLPDAWGCPGEALVRNLLMGHKVARRFGGVTKIGYTPFNNGQLSQWPQLYRGFGMDNCFFYRGVGKHVAKSEFLWEGADGSRLFGFRFGDYARYNYYYLIYREGLLGRTLKDREYQWSAEGTPFHVAIEQSLDRQYGWMDTRLAVHEELLPQALEDCLNYTAADATTTQLLYMMGHDHSWAAREEVGLIEALQKHIPPEREAVFHSSLRDYLDAFRKEAGELQVLTGEMRHANKEGLWTNLFGWTLSSRLYLKQANARVNAKLLGCAEPLAALAWITGSEYPARYLEIAWKKNLYNHAHDAIVGCSVDRVHREMLTRWDEVDTICDEIIRRAMRDVAGRIDASTLAPEHIQLTVFNPLPHDRAGIGEFLLDIPSTNPAVVFAVETPDGRPVPCQVLSRETYMPTLESGYELSMPFIVQRFRAALELDAIPGLGYETLVIKPGIAPAPVAPGARIVSDRELENEHLRARINDNGTIRLHDKRTGRVMDSLGLLENTAEFGDPWNRIRPADDTPILSSAVRATTKVLHSGPLQATIRIAYEFSIPAEKEALQSAGADNPQAPQHDPKATPTLVRSTRRVELPVQLDVTLKKGTPALEMEMRIENRARDHRLRILFPSGIAHATHSAAESQFDVVTRPIATPNPAGWKEAPYSTHPMWYFMDVSDGEEGVALVNDGLTEYEVVDDAARTIAVTLIRAFGKTVFARPTPDAQCPGPHRYRFALLPHRGTWEDAGVFDAVYRMNYPQAALQSAPTRGAEALRRGFLRLTAGDIAFSTVKQSEDGKRLVLRLWNPHERDETIVLESALPIRKASLLTLEEKPEKTLKPAGGNQLWLTAGRKKIITIAVSF